MKKLLVVLLACVMLSPAVLGFPLPYLVEGKVTDSSGNPAPAGTNVVCTIYRDDGSAETFNTTTGSISALASNAYEIAVSVEKEGSDRVNVTAYTSTMRGSASMIVSGDPISINISMSAQQGAVEPPKSVRKDSNPDYLSDYEKITRGDSQTPPAANGDEAPESVAPPAPPAPPSQIEPPQGGQENVSSDEFANTSAAGAQGPDLGVSGQEAGPETRPAKGGDSSGIIVIATIMAAAVAICSFILKNRTNRRK